MTTLLSVADAASLLGVNRSFLDRRRTAGTGPRYVRLSARKIAYRKEALEHWLQEQDRQSTSDRGPNS